MAAAAAEGSVRVSRRAADRLRAGQLWVYRTEVEQAQFGAHAGGQADGQPGALVEVTAGSGSVLGWGTWSSSSTLAVRLFGRGSVPHDGLAETVRGRVRAALHWRAQLAPTTDHTNGRRLLFSEADGMPGVIADQYGAMVVLQLGTQGAARPELRAAVVDELAAGLAGDITIWERGDARVRELEELPLPAPEPLFSRGAPQGKGEFLLDGLRFGFDVSSGQKTGAFLDQRENYRAAAVWAERLGGVALSRALDVCTYQGGFALHLARLCARVTGVDASRAALEVADANYLRNVADLPAEVDWVEADAFELLRAWETAGERWGTVVLDPPAFAKSRRAAEGAVRGYKELNLRAIRMLEPGGLLVTCSCSHHVDEPTFRAAVAEAAADAGRSVHVLESRGAAADHPELLTLPETRYLKCLVCRVA